jgi:hypothetical protein
MHKGSSVLQFEWQSSIAGSALKVKKSNAKIVAVCKRNLNEIELIAGRASSTKVPLLTMPPKSQD